VAIKKLTSKEFWHKTGLEARDLYRREIFEKGKSVYGDKWWGGKYSTQYTIAKKSGKLKGAATAFANKVTPVLTSQLFKDFKSFIKSRRNGVQLGYPTFGDRVAKLRRKGRVGTLTSTDKPLPDVVMKYIKDEYHKYIKRNQKNTTRTHRGKK
jgi:hypothetical protein